jgi:hypothetical protein
LTVQELKKKIGEWKRQLSKDPTHWTFGGFERGEDNKFSNSDLASVLINGTKNISGKDRIF